ncbi:MAG: hypothetical protein ACE5GH_03165 [Fidelibacterota bacterium]
MNARPCLIAFTVLSILGGQTPGDSEFWHSLEQNEKVAFVQGVYTGLAQSLEILRTEGARQKHQDPYWSPPFVHEHSAQRLKEYYLKEGSFDYTQAVDLLDAFYTNPDNAHVDIMVALHILMLHQNGETRRANELLLLKQRDTLEGR